MDEKEQLEQAIATLESQRAVLGDAVVEAALAPMREKLASLQGQAGGGEQRRKQVTVLFADVSGFTALSSELDAEEVTEIINALWTRLDAAVSAHGGQVDKHIGDCVMALWGAEMAHEHDAEDAIRAALAMQDALVDFRSERAVRLAMRIGLNTGPVLLGHVGSRREFTAMGDTVNLASRLEHAAPVGGVLISHDTYRHVRGVFDVQPQEPLTVKGKADPVQTYIVQRAKERAFRMGTRGVEGIETRMIGREAELLALQDAYADAVDGPETRMVMVVGEAGMGKSRLLHEFENWLELRAEPIYYFKGRAVPALKGVPYGIVRDLFAHRFEILESDSAAVALAKFRAGTAGDLPAERADLVGHLVGFDFSASPAVQNLLGGDDFGEQAQAYLLGYLRTMAERQPTVVFLEDVHWADNGSLDLVQQVVSAVPRARLLVVGLSRPALFEQRPHWGEGLAACTRIELKVLSRRASLALVDEILQKVENPPSALRERIVEGAEGNPFYMEELVKMLIDEGVIVQGTDTDRAWQVSRERLDQVHVPPTLIGILQARLDGLPQLEREVLQRAAVIGRVFWDAAVAELTGIEPERATAPLDTLRARELVYRRERSAFAGSEEYLFKHSLLRDVAYETVLLRLRRTYHAQVASWLETHAGERIGEYAGVIGEHLACAGQVEEAAQHLQRAGAKALATGNLRESLEFARRALGLLSEESPQRAGLLVQAGEALLHLGETEAAREHLETGLALARQRGDDRSCAAALDHLGWASYWQGDWTLAQIHLDEGLALARKVDDRARTAHLLSLLGRNAVRQGAFAEAHALLTESEELYQALGDPIGLATILNVMGVDAMERPEEYEKADAYLKKSLELARRAGSRVGAAVALGNLGELARLRGAYETARQYSQETLEICTELGQNARVAVAMGNLGHVELALGNHAAALSAYRGALRQLAKMEATAVVIDVLAGIAGVLARAGQPVRACELLGLITVHPSLSGDTGPLVEQALIAVRTQLAPGELEAGLERGRTLELQAAVAEVLQED